MVLRFLAYVGRHGTGVLAGGLFIGVVIPPLAALLRPYLSAFVFALTASMLLSIERRALLAQLRRPWRLLLILGWVLVAVPVLVAGVARLAGAPPSLVQDLVLWGASPPTLSTPAVALLLGLDPALALLAMVSATILMPFTLPPLVLGLIDLKLAIGILPLMRNLLLFVGGAVVLASAIKWLAGAERVRRHAGEINGLNVVILILFAIAIADGIDGIIVHEPGKVLLYAAVATLASIALQAVSFLAFAWTDRSSALTVGLVGGNHNLALVWANLGAAAPPDLMLFFIVVQLPIYVLPAALKPLYRSLNRAAPG
jgi:BASS family bile acid:Na+ symporter